MTAFKKAVSVVTGAASGIGRTFAVELGRRRGRVVLADIDEPGLHATAQLVRRAQGHAHVVPCDVSDPARIEALAAATEAWAGVPDLVVLDAGLLAAGSLADAASADLQRLLAVNVGGVVEGCRVFGARLRARGRGAILNVGSVAGLMPVPHMAAYAASKAAVVGLSASLHAELRPHGVSVTVLCPSFTRTALVASAAASDDGVRQLGQRLLDTIGAEPHQVVRRGLQAAAAGRLYAVDTLHGRAVWGLGRLAPRTLARLAAIAGGFVPGA